MYKYTHNWIINRMHIMLNINRELKCTLVKFAIDNFKIISNLWACLRNTQERKDILNNEIIVALLALVGTLAGTFGGILTSSKLTAYRIQQLEEKVDKHNNFATRIPIIEEQLKTVDRRLTDLERND